MNKLGYVYELVLNASKSKGFNIFNQYAAIYENKTMVYCKVNGTDKLKGFVKRHKDESTFPCETGNLYSIEDLKNGTIKTSFNRTFYVYDNLGYLQLDENAQEINKNFKIASLKKEFEQTLKTMEFVEKNISIYKEKIKDCEDNLTKSREKLKEYKQNLEEYYEI